MVRSANDVEVGSMTRQCPLIDQFPQHVEQLLDVLEMQPRGGLVKV